MKKKTILQMKRDNWKENQAKAELMTEKFIRIIEQLDCFEKWEYIMLSKIIDRLFDDAGLSNKPDISGLILTLEERFDIKVLKIDSLAEKIKLEAFIEEQANNPYQLQLIA